MFNEDQRRANDFCGRLSGKGNRADKVKDALVDTAIPKRESDTKAGGAQSLSRELGRVRGPQEGGKEPSKRGAGSTPYTRQDSVRGQS
jgi:hypothetical protein